MNSITITASIAYLIIQIFLIDAGFLPFQYNNTLLQGATSKVASSHTLATIYSTADSNGKMKLLLKVKDSDRFQDKFKVKVSLDDNSTMLALDIDREELHQLFTDENIMRIEPDYQVSVALDSNEKFVRHMGENIPQNVDAVLQNRKFFWRNNPPGSIKLCIADSGYALHDDLPKFPNVNGTNGRGEQWYFDGLGHGTHVSGIVAATGKNKRGIYGIIPSTYNGKFKLHITKAFDQFGRATQSDVIAAVNDCVANGANVISLSVQCQSCYSSTEDEYYQSLFRNNVLVIAAAGNEGNSGYSYPASYSSVISVASVSSSLKHSYFSQYNKQVELSAPGEFIHSTYLNNGYQYISGTSMATPQVAAVSCLLWMHFPNCTNLQIRNALAFSAKRLAHTCNRRTGLGLIQAKNAYDTLKKGNCGGDLGAHYAVGGCEQLELLTMSPTLLPTLRIGYSREPMETKKERKKARRKRKRILKKNKRARKKNRRFQKRNKTKTISNKPTQISSLPSLNPTNQPSKHSTIVELASSSPSIYSSQLNSNLNTTVPTQIPSVNLSLFHPSMEPSNLPSKNSVLILMNATNA